MRLDKFASRHMAGYPRTIPYVEVLARRCPAADWRPGRVGDRSQGTDPAGLSRLALGGEPLAETATGPA